jgi:FKBP-type peptidyl-prolyl cis-trans isomerase FkpA
MSVTAVPIRPIKKGSLTKLWIGLGALALAAAGIAWAGTKDQVVMSDQAGFLERNGKRSGVVTTPSGLQYQILDEGTGARPSPYDVVSVEYEGRLLNGTVFDASARHGNQPAQLPVAGVIPGWTEALMLMKKGAKYRLWIPPELAYGPQGAGGVIPPNAVLDFDVTLVDIAPNAALQQMQGGGGGRPPGM